MAEAEAQAVRLAPDTLDKVIAGEAPMNVFFELGTEQLEAIAVLGYRAYQQGKTAEARAIFEGLTAVNSQLYLGYAGLGAIALAEEKAEEARGYLEKAVSLNPNDASVQANLGETLLRLGKYEEAAAVLNEALKLDPDGHDAGVNRARAILAGMDAVLTELVKAHEEKE